MAVDSGFAIIHGVDQWCRASHRDTSLDMDGGVVQLSWETEARHDAPESPLPEPAGLAFDPWCRLYHSVPEQGQVERLHWAATGERAQPKPIFAGMPQSLGDFSPAAPVTPLGRPAGLAVDDGGNLFVADAGRGCVWVYDLLERQLIRRLPLPGLLDLCSDGRRAYVLLPGEVMTLDARGTPFSTALTAALAAPARITAGRDGQLYVLDQAGSPDARVVPLERPDEWLAAPRAGAIVMADDQTLVVARGPEEDLLQFHIEAGLRWQLPHLTALHYDGRGIVLTPDHRIGYWTANGFRHATRARLRYPRQGRVIGFRLDGGEFQNAWGRIFVDACVPRGSSLSVGCLVLDEPPADATPLEHALPENAGLVTLPRPDLSPPMPPANMLSQRLTLRPLHRREGPELPWIRPDEDFITYEAPVIEQQGRYLWLVLEFSGNGRVSPKVRTVRVEHHSHEWLRHLPKLYSRDALAADFMRRYLAPAEGTMRDLGMRAARRQVLLDPMAAPAELLPWLAGFVGLVLDRRWSEQARRQAIQEAIWLFRYRGTVMGVKRFLEIYLGREVVIIEHFKVRGLGGAIVGDDAVAANSVLGAGFRVGGRIGEDEAAGINGTNLLDAFATRAHRFSVVLPLTLEPAQLDVVRTILDRHRPAHTLYDICSVDTGMRAGSGLYAGLTSLVGRTSGFGQLRLGSSQLGQSDLLGRARPGISAGNDFLGHGGRVG